VKSAAATQWTRDGRVVPREELTFDATYFSVYRGDPKREAMYRQERKQIEELVPSGRILDVGCGLGGFLAGFVPEKWDRYGTDISDVAIAEARARGIKVNDFAEAYSYPPSFFDVIVWRGTLQLIPTPFALIQTCIRLLNPGGYLVFLATPNSNSPYYQRFRTLPFLTPHLNYLIPSDIMMRDALQNFGLEVVKIRYPYLGGPYARPLRDVALYLLSFVGIRRKFPFWRSSMEIYARKPVASASDR
jgi:SAM-dependent methyltransferase